MFRSVFPVRVKRRPSRLLLTVFVQLAVILCTLGLGWAKDEAAQLAPRYRNWLNRDVVYIISKQEREAFLHAASDEERDRFIERFWEVRNPTPGSPNNSYRTEHYRRIEYADQYFGHASHTDGWKTDMGRIYITLGEPSQRQKLLGLQKVTPMEIWFYSNSNPALPPFFYIIFYQREISDDFRLYSPYSDGPERLITAEVGPSRSSALRILIQDAGKDVARETLSLLPDEPVDFQNGQISLQSDVMLATIKNLANNPISQQALELRRHLLEDVTHRIVLGDEFLDVLTMPLRDAGGNMNLHYLLRLKKPEDFSIGETAKGGGYYYSILSSVKVRTPDGKLVLDEERKVAKNITQDEFDKVKDKVFGYEGWLPLPPNKYKIEFQLTNLLRGAAYRKEMEVDVPQVLPDALQVSDVVPFSEAIPLAPQSGQILPFSGAGIRFVPLAGPQLELVQGQDLNVFYQVWDRGALNRPRTGKKILVDYAYGRMGTHDTQTIHDEISLEQLDDGGSILNGKRIPTVDLSPGNYRLVMTLTDSETQAKVFGSLSFGVSSVTNSHAAWDVDDENIANDLKDGNADYQRARCYLALSDKVHAIASFEKAYARNSEDERFRKALVELYFGQQTYPRIAELYASGFDRSTDEATMLRVAESFDKLGNVRKALSLMESGTVLKPENGPLLLALAEYYRKNGDLEKAATTEEKGKKILAAHSST
jgi:GWxTD domain-containing protein